MKLQSGGGGSRASPRQIGRGWLDLPREDRPSSLRVPCMEAYSSWRIFLLTLGPQPAWAGWWQHPPTRVHGCSGQCVALLSIYCNDSWHFFGTIWYFWVMLSTIELILTDSDQDSDWFWLILTDSDRYSVWFWPILIKFWVILNNFDKFLPRSWPRFWLILTDSKWLWPKFWLMLTDSDQDSDRFWLIPFQIKILTDSEPNSYWFWLILTKYKQFFESGIKGEECWMDSSHIY